MAFHRIGPPVNAFRSAHPELAAGTMSLDLLFERLREVIQQPFCDLASRRDWCAKGRSR